MRLSAYFLCLLCSIWSYNVVTVEKAYSRSFSRFSLLLTPLFFLCIVFMLGYSPRLALSSSISLSLLLLFVVSFFTYHIPHYSRWLCVPLCAFLVCLCCVCSHQEGTITSQTAIVSQRWVISCVFSYYFTHHSFLCFTQLLWVRVAFVIHSGPHHPHP